MKSQNDFKFQNAWKADNDELASEIVSFWSHHGALTGEKGRQRAQQVVYIIRNKLDEIIGISTVAKIMHDPIEHYVYLYRCFIAAEYRAPGLETALTIKTRDFLEGIYSGEKPSAIGFLVVAQIDVLKRYNKAIWPGTELMYIGNTEKVIRYACIISKESKFSITFFLFREMFA